MQKVMALVHIFFAVFIINKVEGLYNPNYPFIIINGNRSLITDIVTTTRDGRSFRYYKTGSAKVVTKKVEHVPVVIDKTCLLVPEIGPCRAKIPMYFFDPASKNCSVFLWGGCQGNGNRFDRVSDCLGTCLSSPGYFPRRPRYCQLTFDYGWCFGAEERWYYDFRYKDCKKTIYSGCGGNKNNFYNQEQCDKLCRFGKYGGEAKKRSKDEIKKVLVIDPPNAKTKKMVVKPPDNSRRQFDQPAKERDNDTSQTIRTITDV